MKQRKKRYQNANNKQANVIGWRICRNLSTTYIKHRVESVTVTSFT